MPGKAIEGLVNIIAARIKQQKGKERKKHNMRLFDKNKSGRLVLASMMAFGVVTMFNISVGDAAKQVKPVIVGSAQIIYPKVAGKPPALAVGSMSKDVSECQGVGGLRPLEQQPAGHDILLHSWSSRQ
ncbi:hypothetical protein ACTNDZ_12395 [Selenomonas montiformis]|uniref:hypothetical protein n=1 Tax=Selenomonas montiformis TaxID=2652285 RepID=UPI003F890B1A